MATIWASTRDPLKKGVENTRPSPQATSSPHLTAKQPAVPRYELGQDDQEEATAAPDPELCLVGQLEDADGQPMGRVHIDRTQLLGIGRYSQVYRGHLLGDGSSSRHPKAVAVKLYTNPRDDRAKLETEMSLLRDLKGRPGIIGLHSRMAPAGLVLEIAEGGNLAERIFSPDRLDAAVLVGWTDNLVSALESLQAARIQHHDIKPHNMLLSRDQQRLFLADFGCASRTAAPPDASPVLEGTLGYTAPELLSLDASPSPDAAAASAAYSLGVTLYAMLTGREPFAALGRSTGTQLVIAIRRGFDRAGCNPWHLRAGLAEDDPRICQLQAMATQCTALDPAQRPTVTQLRQQLDAITAHTPS